MARLEDYSIEQLEVKKRICQEELQEMIDYSIIHRISKKIKFDIRKLIGYLFLIEMAIFIGLMLVMITPIFFAPTEENRDYMMNFMPIISFMILPLMITILLFGTDQTGPKRKYLKDLNRAIRIKKEVTLENELHNLNDENEKLEYKSSFKYDFKTKMANTDLKKEIVQSIVSFMNHRGGILIIGINDEKKVLGIDKDLKLFRNWDSYQLAIQNTIRDYTKSALSDFFIIKKMEKNGKQLCSIYVNPSPKPIYYVDGNNEDFFVRQGNQSVKLTTKQANDYINSHWSHPSTT